MNGEHTLSTQVTVSFRRTTLTRPVTRRDKQLAALAASRLPVVRPPMWHDQKR